MKIVVIDGVEYEQLDWVEGFMCDSDVIILRPLPKPKKTLVEIAKSFWKSEEEFRQQLPMQSAVYDAIEERLAALEQRDAKREEK